MADPISIAVASFVSSLGASAAVSTFVGAAVGRLVVGAAISLVSAALTRRSMAGDTKREDLKRELSTPTERPPYRHVYGETRAVGSLVAWPVDGHILWACYLLNSRPSDMSNLELILDDRNIPYSGDPFTFSDLNGAVTSGPDVGNFVNFWVQTGSQTTPPQRFLNDMAYDAVTNPEGFKSTDAWQGRTVIWMRIDSGQKDKRAERWPSAPPQVEVKARYSLLYDPRTDTTAWSDNQALVLLDALMNNPVQPYQALNLAMDSFEWGADVADEAVPLKSGGSEPRYRAAGTVVFSEGVELEDILEPITVAGASKLTRIRGRIGMIPAATKAASQTIDTVIDKIEVNWLKPSRELPTRILGSYVSVARGYEDADLPPYEIPGAQAADGGVAKTNSLRMGMVESPTQAMRLVKIAGYDARRQRTIKTTLPPVNTNLISGAEATVSFPSDYAALDGDYEVLSITPNVKMTDSGVHLRSEVELLIVDDTGLSWTAAVDEVDIYDEPYDTSSATVAPGGAISASIEYTDTGDTNIPTIRFEFDPSPTSSVQVYEWEYARNGGDWQSGGQIGDEIVDGDGDVFGYLDIASTTDTYDIRVRAWSDDRASDWVEITGVGVPFDLTVDTSSGGLASATFTGTAPGAVNFQGVKLYSAPEGDPFGSAVAESGVIAVTPASSYSVTFGDADAVNEIANAEFDSSTGWTLGTGWTIGGGVANHATGATSLIYRSVTLDDAEDYRYSYDMTVNSGSTASLFRIIGDTTVNSTTYNSTGLHQGIITSPINSGTAGILANSSLDVDIDYLYLVKDTPNALPLGVRDYWVVPVTNTGAEGDPVGPFTLTIY